MRNRSQTLKWRRPLVRPARHDTSMEERVGRHVVIMDNGCWAYNGQLDHYGQAHYGGTGHGGVFGVAAHRFVYETLVGDIPPGMELHHLCFNRGCVNPNHVTPLTIEEHGAIHEEIRQRLVS